MSKPEEIAEAARSNGQYAAAITDHGSMAGTLAFQKACDKFGIKPIHGVEAYYVPEVSSDTDDKSAERFHLIVLAKNQNGLEKMFKIQQKCWTDSFYYKPRMEWADLEYLAGDAVVLSGCMASELARSLEHGDEQRAHRIVKNFAKTFGEDYYIEIQPWNRPGLNEQLFDFAQTYNLRAVGTLDCHYPKKSDADIEEMLLMMGMMPSLKAADDRHAKEMAQEACNHFSLIDQLNLMYPNRFLKFGDISPYVMDTDEARNLFVESCGSMTESLMESTEEIADKCTSSIVTGKNYLPKFDDKFDSSWYLREIAELGLYEKGLLNEPGYRERLDEEIGIVEKLNFSDYFLIVWDICRYADEQKIARGPGRGSVGGSLLAYALNITMVDPLKYGLLFSRFINEERINFPDIDLDFADKRRNEMKDYIVQKWGEDYTASISTYSTFQPKGLLKSLLSVYRVPFQEANKLTPKINTLEDIRTHPEAREVCKVWPRIPEIASRLEGRIKGNGGHAAGVVISSVPLWKIAPIETRGVAGEDSRLKVIAYDMNETEEVGLWKYDFLGLKALSVIDDCINKIKDIHGVDVRNASLSLDDQDVIDNFNKDSMVGIFQAEGAGYKNLIAEMGIDSFSDIVASNALVRPGASVTQGAQYIGVKKGKKEAIYPHKILEPILSETFGTFVYQEQLMQTVVILADFSWAEADYLRKIIGKKRDSAEFDAFRDKFVENSQAFISKQVAEAMWDDFEKASLYMFNKSHSVGYSLLTYQTMWLKFHYPAEFIWASLYNEDKPEDVSSFLVEANRLGIEIQGIDINKSSKNFSVDENGIMFGLKNVSGLGESAADEIIEKRPYCSFEEFTNRVRKSKVKTNVVENLEKVGAFISIGHDPGYDIKRYYLPILNYARYAEEDGLFADMTSCLSDISETNGIHIVKAMVKSVTRKNGWFRVEFEDLTGTNSFFADDPDANIKKKDYILALVGEKSLIAFCDPYEEEDDLIAFLNHRNVYEYEGVIESMLQPINANLAIVVSARWFKTKNGKLMGTMWTWNQFDHKFEKFTIFPGQYEEYSKYLTKWNQVVIRRGSKSGTIDNLIQFDEYVKLKKLSADH